MENHITTKTNKLNLEQLLSHVEELSPKDKILFLRKLRVSMQKKKAEVVSSQRKWTQESVGNIVFV